MQKCKNCVWYIGGISGNESCANLSALGIEKAEQCQYFLSRNDPVNHPAHYTNRQHECIDEMLTAFGKEAVIHFCICNAWKYRYRADSKGTHDQDMEKADWYINKAMELKGEITND
jgi:hypothetical protein